MTNARWWRGAGWYVLMLVGTAVLARVVVLVAVSDESLEEDARSALTSQFNLTHISTVSPKYLFQFYIMSMAAGQLLACVLGGMLAHSAALSTLRAKYAVAGLGACGIAAVNYAVPLPSVTRIVRPDFVGYLLDWDMVIDLNLRESGLLPDLVAALAAFPLWAAIGVGIGLGIGRQRTGAGGGMWAGLISVAWYVVSPFLLIVFLPFDWEQEEVIMAMSLLIPNFIINSSSIVLAPFGLLMYAVLAYCGGTSIARRRAATTNTPPVPLPDEAMGDGPAT